VDVDPAKVMVEVPLLNVPPVMFRSPDNVTVVVPKSIVPLDTFQLLEIVTA
jgi:hypothetical protein